MGKINNSKLPKRLLNKRGELVDTSLIRNDHLQKHVIAEKIGVQVFKFIKSLDKLNNQIKTGVTKYKKSLISDGKRESKQKFGVTINTYDDTFRIIEMYTKKIDMDDNIQIALSLLREYKEKWISGAHPIARTLFDKFLKLEKKGKINVQLLIELKEIQISDPIWNKITSSIDAAINSAVKKSAVMIQFRETTNTEWKTLKLSVSGADDLVNQLVADNNFKYKFWVTI